MRALPSKQKQTEIIVADPKKSLQITFFLRIIMSTVLVPPHDLRLLLLYSDSPFHVLVLN